MTRTRTMTLAVALVLMAGALSWPACSAEAQRAPESCKGGTLRPEQDGDDLIIKGKIQNGQLIPLDCRVRAGIYKFRNVHILGGSTPASPTPR
jgi:hypothetical protein